MRLIRKTHTRNAKWQSALLILFTFLFIPGSIYLKFIDGQHYLEEQSNLIFHSALRETLDSRAFSQHTKNTRPIQLIPLESIERESENTTKYSHSPRNFSHLLFNPDSLMYRVNILFAHQRIESRCLISYTDLNTKETFQSNCKPFDNDLYHASIRLVGLNGEWVVAECFLAFSLFSIFNSGNWNLSVLLIYFLSLIGLFLFNKFSTNRLSKRSIKDEEIDQNFVPDASSKELDSNHTDRISTVLFKPDQGILYTETASEYLTPQLAKLMKLFMASPDHFLKNEDIMVSLWGNVGTKNKLNNLISQLRKKLYTLDPNVKLENFSGTGYKLVCKPEEEKSRNLERKGNISH